MLISEFAEHEGPIPVLTIPESMLEASTMNLSAFVLRIMAVDYQVRAGYVVAGALAHPHRCLCTELTVARLGACTRVRVRACAHDAERTDS